MQYESTKNNLVVKICYFGLIHNRSVNFPLFKLVERKV